MVLVGIEIHKNTPFDSVLNREAIWFVRSGSPFPNKQSPLFTAVVSASDLHTAVTVVDNFFQLQRWSEIPAFKIAKLCFEIVCRVSNYGYYHRNFSDGLI